MPRGWFRTLATFLVLAFLAGQLASAQHQGECSHETEHDTDGCVICALAHHITVVIDAPPPGMVLPVTGAAAVIELPRLRESPLLLAFRPRSPPRFLLAAC